MGDVFMIWSLLAAASKLIIYVASFLAVGTLLFRLGLPRAGDEVADALRPLAIAATLIAIAATLFRVLVQAGRLMDDWGGMVDPNIVMISLQGPLGESTYVRLGGLALILLAALFRPVRAPATLFGAIMVAASFALTGHATREPQWLLGGLITFHLLAVAYWFGALAPLYRLTLFDGGASHAAEIADRFGAQVLVLSADVRRVDGHYVVTTHGGRRASDLDAVEWCARAEALGAGEILLNSMDADGTKAGFDLRMITAARAAVHIPVIASGGAGAVEHFAPAVEAGADAVLAASVFHFGDMTIGQVKDEMAGHGLVVRR